ncbi:helix-turn-helix domain-containing protein [Lacticaseibacillus jixiensis]|uniref:helix-turn-helix domain-containing protein n=1 Tax=Lacticaseibacillus jixiensis TaxID=3231926 RepID=UPI0036F28A88
MNAERLTDLRHEHPRLRQADVAEVLGIGTSTYSMYEQGLREPDDETKLKLARYFGVSVDYLVGNSDLPTAAPRHAVDTELKALRHMLRDDTAAVTYADQPLSQLSRQALAALIEGVLAAADALEAIERTKE